jgi:ankyrin repeat protein
MDGSTQIFKYFLPMHDYLKSSTPLHQAVMQRHVSLARFFLDQGALPHIRESGLFDESQCLQLPLVYAIQNNDIEMVQLFLDYDIRKYGEGFHYNYIKAAMDINSFIIFKMLLENGMTLKIPQHLNEAIQSSYQNAIPLMSFSSSNSEELDDYFSMVEMLISKHTNLLNKQDFLRRYPLDHAMYIHNKRLITLLVKYGAIQASKFLGGEENNFTVSNSIVEFTRHEIEYTNLCFLSNFLIV